jgi:hypothetical protein
MRDRRYSLVAHRLRPDWLKIEALDASFLCDPVTPSVGVSKFTDGPSARRSISAVALAADCRCCPACHCAHSLPPSSSSGFLPRKREEETLARQFPPVQYRHQTAEASKFRHRRVVGEPDVSAVHRCSSWPIRRCERRAGLATAGPPVRYPSSPWTATPRPPSAASDAATSVPSNGRTRRGTACASNYRSARQACPDQDDGRRNGLWRIQRDGCVTAAVVDSPRADGRPDLVQGTGHCVRANPRMVRV